MELVVRALRRGVAAPDEAGGLDLVLLPDLRRGGVAYLSAVRFRGGAFFGYIGQLGSERLICARRWPAQTCLGGDERARATARAKQAL